MKLYGTLLVLAAVAMTAVACNGESASEAPEPAPKDVVAEAAEKTLAAETNEIIVSSTGASGERYSYSGLIDLPAGDFDLRLDPGGASPDTFGRVPQRLIAQKGEEAVNDVVRQRSPAGRMFEAREDCWFSNPMPVHINGGMSIEEGGTLAGSVIESLPHEIASAERIGDGMYAVELVESASRPRDITKSETDRAWGFRRLLDDLAGPIEVGVSGGRISSLRLSVDDYRPFYSPGLYRPERADTEPQDGVSLEVQLADSDRELKVESPGCFIVT